MVLSDQSSLIRVAAKTSRPPWCWWVLWLLCIKVSFWFGANFFSDGWRHFVEAGVYVLLLALLYWKTRVREVFLTTPLFVRVTAVALVVLALSAQLARNSIGTYPLVSWTMYTSPHLMEWSYLEVIGVRADGTEVALSSSKDFPFNPRPFLDKLNRFDTCRIDERLESWERDNYERNIEEALRAWIELKNGRNAGEPFTSVVLRRNTIDSEFGVVKETLVQVEWDSENKDGMPSVEHLISSTGQN